MAREIKFRGFNRKNNVWLYGFYLQNRGAHFVCPDEFATGKSWDDYEIDPDTRGEFTGRKDKNGVEIYEGDVVIQHGHGINDIQGCVTYEPSSAMFVLSYETYGCMHTETLQSKKVYNDYNTQFSVEHTFEVIGNIHDNPELLKQREPNQNEL